MSNVTSFSYYYKRKHGDIPLPELLHRIDRLPTTLNVYREPTISQMIEGTFGSDTLQQALSVIRGDKT